eukprot:TRINITY_DN50912_c0_g4_i1.p1 TRINITY_DN50912_c0_g4~~TRINITY_DN50912_c0_g4_i1.p1  ORF type:complete len:583 (-),score=142.05 TRINITY_DN50912_c0_g4_i1:112-1860(-)
MAVPPVIDLDEDDTVDAAAAPLGTPAAAVSSTAAPEQASRPRSAHPAAQLHLISWNVAGWKTTTDQIHRLGGIKDFLQRHKADILCLQEVKLTAKAVAEGAARLGAEPSSNGGYDSFWACNEGSGAQRQGLNGVATLAREGLVQRADSAPLKDAELDAEGRCLLTDFGDFVIFNVYVPNGSGGSRLPYKMRWLRALRQAMQRERSNGKAVLLVGDMNMKNRPSDSHWTFRSVEVRELAALAKREPDATFKAEWREAASAAIAAWPEVCEALRAKQCRPIVTRNSRSGQSYQRWGIFVKNTAGEEVRVGPPFDAEDHARGSYLIDGVGVEDDGTFVVGQAAADAAFVLQRPNELSVSALAECLKRVANIELTTAFKQFLSDLSGCSTTAPAIRSWLHKMMQEDGMVDSFAEVHPLAEERFTCWDQYKNMRYENIGSRIDYVLVDRKFFEKHGRAGGPLYAPLRGAAAASGAGSKIAAAAAATLGGLSEPSSMVGGGMQTLEKGEYAEHFRPSPGTGMVYTPPQLSDHIAVSLLLEGCNVAAVGTQRQKDPSTQKCQPHKAAKRITDFFAPKAAKRLCATGAGA